MEAKKFYEVQRIDFETKNPHDIEAQYFDAIDMDYDQIGIFENLEDAKKCYEKNIEIYCKDMGSYYLSSGGAIEVLECEPDEDGEYDLEYATCPGEYEIFELPDYEDSHDEDEDEDDE